VDVNECSGTGGLPVCWVSELDLCFEEGWGFSLPFRGLGTPGRGLIGRLAD